MRSLLFICVIIGVFNTSALIGGNSPYFIRLDAEDGLAQNTVYCILQDDRGFMWFGTKDGLSRYDGFQFRNYRHEKNDSTSIGNNCIRSLFQDSNGRIWVGTDVGAYIYHPDQDRFELFDVTTSNGIGIKNEVNDIKQDHDGIYWFAVDWQGVFSYDPDNGKLKFYELDAVVNAWCIHVDKENKVWIGTHGGGLNYFDDEKQRFEKAVFSTPEEQDSNNDDVFRIFQDNYNDLFITTANSGVKRLNLVTNKIEQFLPLQNFSSLFFRDVIRKSDQEIWFATGGGVCTFDIQKKKVEFLKHSHFDPYSLSDNAVYSIYKDREGGVWIGTYFGGVNYYPYQYTPFNKFYPIEKIDKRYTMVGRRIREFQLAENGDIWIGTEDGGLSLYDPNKNVFEHFFPDGQPGSISFNNIHGLLVDGDLLWIGTYNHGLEIMDLKTKKIVRHYDKSNQENSLPDNSIFSIYKDHSGRVWIGTLYGLCYYNPETDDFTRVSFMKSIFISDILQTKDGMIWVASLGKGLFRFNPANNEWTVFKNNPGDSTSLSHNKVISLFEDSQMSLWVTTEGGGVCRYYPDDESFETFASGEGLPNNVVFKIVEDDFSNLWFSTNQGLVCMSLNDFSIKKYTKSDGLLSDQFNYKSGIKDKNGQLYFGGLDGFISFDPTTFISNIIPPPVYITQFDLFNTPVKPGELNSPLKQSIEFTEQIELDYNQTSFSFYFAALSFVAPEKNQYKYMLDGFDKDWISPGKVNKAVYSNIPPGNYVFKVKASNNNNVWNDDYAFVKLYIRPPFYLTIWAYITYAGVGFGLIVLLFIIYRNKIRAKNRHRQEVFENEKSKEMYNAKIAFFTNITHEIRTPLSLIKGPLDYILNEKVTAKEREEYLKVIDRNTNRLLDLSNQLLDFRKTEQENFLLNYIEIDIPELIEEVYMRFAAAALNRNLHVEKSLPSENFYADVDKEALTKILSNLFSNAIKYSESYINLELTQENETFIVTISNDGDKIDEAIQEKIFEPFYQIDNKKQEHVIAGTGLGLPLARSLAELHNGTLECLNSHATLNVFRLVLPLKQPNSIRIKSLDSVDAPDYQVSEAADRFAKLTKPSLLVVEDDVDFRNFLCNQLSRHYNINKAVNGVDGLKKLEEEHVDIIISDITMPVMDGLQFCEEVKSNLDYSHIPIILLTARANLQSKIEGLDVGADAYVEKPFSMEYLLAQVFNLLSNRNKLKESFVNSPLEKIRSIAPTKADEEFLKRVTDIIHENISDPRFNVDQLASNLNMSRSSLHRKIKGISELTPNEFILLTKLKKAATYIQEGIRVNEVCFLVGFSSPSYFSKAFKKQFGVSPTGWLR
ncbi:hybrid sensor histidine kinase/response regulator transcription factor [Thermophagus sp. OGC60D27]|uniref:hybrid sensor histidine kinase/response regulator transcription factor n=1 Tax=Thermophagus sp. OGC60D27 TaxID=3458415 RepID=UPI004037DC3D